MYKENTILRNHQPSPEEVKRYLNKWNETQDYVDQENALNKLFMDICKDNNSIENILIKCSALNDFYSTNIFKVHYVAKHYLSKNIDERLNRNDLTLVNDLTPITIKGETKNFYSFASKYCSHHKPDVYPIYDSYVHKVLKYYSNRDDKLPKFKDTDLKNYESYVEVINDFRSRYGLEEFSVKDIDKYLWQLGKEAFSEY